MRKGLIPSLTIAGVMTLGTLNVTAADDFTKKSSYFSKAVLLGTDTDGTKGNFKSITDIRDISAITFTVKADKTAAKLASQGELSLTGRLGTQTSSGGYDVHEWSFTPYKYDSDGEVMYDDDTLLPVPDREVTFEKITDEFYTATLEAPEGFFLDNDDFASIWFDCDNNDYSVMLTGVVLEFDDTYMSKDVKNCTVTVSPSVYIYSGAEKKPTATVKYGSKKLTEGTDYTLSYTSNINAGTATVTVKGKGKYTGTFKKNFTISAKSLSSATVTIPNTSYAYTGKAIAPTPSVKVGSTALVKGTDYTVSYSSNTDIGTATVTVTGKGNYSGSVSKTYKILPTATTLSSVTSAKANTASVNWTKNTTGSGYQILYSTSSSFTSYSVKTIGASSQVSTSLTSLTSGKTYYVKIRAFKTVGSTKYYGAYSSVKTVKIK